MKKGAYLGGIRSVKDLMDRCVVDEFCGCWRYAGSVPDDGPKLHLRLGDKQVVMRGRRGAVCLSTGKGVPKGMVVYATRDCEHMDCVNPDHCRVGTRADRGRSRRGREPTLRMLQANTANGMKRAKLTPEAAKAIRASNKTIVQLAAEYGVMTSRISAVRLGQAWKETLDGASVFSWRP